MADIPPPPPGYQIQAQISGGVPPPPAGYVVQSPSGMPGATEQLPDQVVHAPARLPGILGSINDFGNDLGDATMHHLANLPLGLGQLVGHGITAAADATMSPDNPVRQMIDSTGRNYDAKLHDREKSYQEQVPTNTGSLIGAGVGEVLPWAVGLGELRAAGLIPKATTLAGKVGTLALEGGAMGASQPVTSGPATPLADMITGDKSAPSFAEQKAQQIATGALSGPMLYGGGKAITGVASGVRDIGQHLLNPQAVADANIAHLFGSDPSVVTQLRAAPSLVPGETPSAAQVLATPEAVQAERMLRNNPASAPAFVARDNANNAARQAIVSKLAGTPQEMSDALATRRANAATFIESSLTPSTPATRWAGAKNALQNVIDNPARMPSADFDAVKSARGIVDKVRSGAMQEDDALEELGYLSDSVSTQKAQKAFGVAMQAIDKNMVDPSGVLRTIATIRNGPLGVNPKVAEGLDFLSSRIEGGKNIRGKIGTDVLDAVRQQASRLLGNAKAPGSPVGTQQGVALGPVKNQIVDAIDQVAPGYRDYVARYRADSTPINTMASVGKLADPNAPGSLNAAGDPQLAISRLRQVLRGDDKAKFPMSDAARQQLDQVRESLLRRTISDNKISASGPGTAADLQAQGGLAAMLFGKNMGATGGPLGRIVGGGAGALLGSHFGPAGTVVGSGLGASIMDALGGANSRVVGRVGESAADAQKAAAAIERVMAKSKNKSGSDLVDMLLLGGTPAATQPALPPRKP